MNDQTAFDLQTVRDFARRAILSSAEDVDYLGIGEQFSDEENWPSEEAAYDAMLAAVDAERRKATVTVSWPDEQPQDERDTRPLIERLPPEDAERVAALIDERDCWRREVLELRTRVGAQNKRDGDVRAVAALLAAFEPDALETEHLAALAMLRTRFGPQIAALEARDTKGV